MAKLEPLPGTSDVWPPETERWVFLENTARRVFALYGFAELRTPILERTDVFVRSIGTDTEVVQKEMYSFHDRGGRSLTLRPEGTAGVMRAIAHQGIMPGEEKRVFYGGPMFRGERPAAGRKRQFHQIGIEAVGKCNPAVDAECAMALLHFLDEIGVVQRRFLINSRGSGEDRKRAAGVLRDFFRPQAEGMCEDCQRRLDSNVWRILDCKNPQCHGIIAKAPPILEMFGADSQAFFLEVRRILDACGVEYQVAPHLVRGLDYYQHTVFEVVCDSPHLGAQNAIAGGGRYEIELPGSRKPIQGVGFAFGVERLLMALGEPASEAAAIGPAEVYVAAVGDGTLIIALELAEKLRRAGLRVCCENEQRSMKAQMRSADKSGAELALIIGQEEAAGDQLTIKYLRESRQLTLPGNEAKTVVLEWFGRNNA